MRQCLTPLEHSGVVWFLDWQDLHPLSLCHHQMWSMWLPDCTHFMSSYGGIAAHLPSQESIYNRIQMFPHIGFSLVSGCSPHPTSHLRSNSRSTEISTNTFVENPDYKDGVLSTCNSHKRVQPHIPVAVIHMMWEAKTAFIQNYVRHITDSKKKILGNKQWIESKLKKGRELRTSFGSNEFLPKWSKERLRGDGLSKAFYRYKKKLKQYEILLAFNSPFHSVTTTPPALLDSSLISVDGRPVGPSLNPMVKVPTNVTGEAGRPTSAEKMLQRQLQLQLSNN